LSLTITRTGRVVLLEINRPEALNALSSELLAELASELDSIAVDPGVGAVVLSGAGEKAFIAGADIEELATMSPVEARQYAELGQSIARRLETMRAVTIAAVSGYALGGGCEMALACDLRIASETAVFGQPEVNLGIIPGWGATQRLARATNIGFAKEMILSGRQVDAAEALARGIVQRVVGPGQARSVALELAAEIAAKGPLAVAYAKQAANRALSGDHVANLEHEADLFAILFSTLDAKEGLQAFVQKRSPTFTGR
jgi:enoyl-CoA hydratase